jgi:hypothetical protein
VPAGASKPPKPGAPHAVIEPSVLRAAKARYGSIKAWGDSDFGGSDAPAGSGYTKIYSTRGAFAALKADGSITVWGDSGSGGSTSYCNAS